MAELQFTPLFEVHFDSSINEQFYLEVGSNSSSQLSGSGTSFLDTPDMIDETDAIYFYFGWTSVDSSWLIRRQVRLTALTVDANILSNGGIPDLATGWPSRVSLIYV